MQGPLTRKRHCDLQHQRRKDDIYQKTKKTSTTAGFEPALPKELAYWINFRGKHVNHSVTLPCVCWCLADKFEDMLWGYHQIWGPPHTAAPPHYDTTITALHSPLPLWQWTVSALSTQKEHTDLNKKVYWRLQWNFQFLEFPRSRGNGCTESGYHRKWWLMLCHMGINEERLNYISCKYSSG